MNNKSFSGEKALSFGWSTFKANIVFLLSLALIPFAISFVSNRLQDSLSEMAVMSMIIGLGSWLLSALINIGIIKIALKFVDGKKGEFSELFSGGKLLLNFLLTSILYGLIVLAGLILLVVPGIIWAIKYQYSLYLVVDKNMSPMQAIKTSGKMTSGVKWSLLGFAIIILLINLLGVLALGIGVLVSTPVTFLAVAHVYRQLGKQ
ncbi:MAG: hypothetical protein ABIH88_02295 [Patescibacteria group bacterium]